MNVSTVIVISKMMIVIFPRSRNTHDIIFRTIEIGVALWFPCVLWNCIRPEQLWCLNPKKILDRRWNNRKQASADPAGGLCLQSPPPPGAEKEKARLRDNSVSGDGRSYSSTSETSTTDEGK